MKPDFLTILAASEADRRDMFLTAATRLGTPIQNIEKDFWVCWVLDVLFNDRADDEPRLLFKGGTSLSKSYGLISRFSEDIDITVFREDLAQPVSIEELEGLSGKKQRARLETIKQACRQYILGPLRSRIESRMQGQLAQAGIAEASLRVDIDPADADQQTLLISYPSVDASPGDYVGSAVKIEGGAKSALDPHRLTTVRPYIADDVPRLDLVVGGITTIDPERTFWDKIIILHGQHRWFERRGELRRQGQRVSRHYYDVFKLLQADVGHRAIGNLELARDCARHARMFFNSADLDLASATPGTFAIAPTPGMEKTLQRDYVAMSGMIFGGAPSFQEVLEAIRILENRLNDGPPF